MLQTLRNFRRGMYLLYMLGRYDAGDALETLGLPVFISRLFGLFAQSNLPRRDGRRLCMALTAMGPTFIKLGQALSTRADLVGEEIAYDLADLQDNLKPFPGSIARKIIEAELGAPVSKIFQSFNDIPVAAASIAQVHYAVTNEGRPVAVKVLRPGIRKIFTRDIELFYWLAGHLEQCVPTARRLRPVAIVETLEKSIRREMDLRIEAASADTLRENTAQDMGFYVPEVDWNLTSEKVMVMERVDGIPISDIPALQAAGHDLNHLVQLAADSFFKQVFRDGFFHADMHPGNLFVSPEGHLIAVDFGITGWLDKRTRWFVAEILRGFLAQDFKHVAELHIRAGYVPAHHSVEDFALACRAIAMPILGKPLQDISLGRLFGQLLKITALYDMETQPQLLLLQKNMVLAEGVGRMLNPNVNMWQLAEPLIQDWARENLSPQGRIKLAADEIKEAAKRLPEMAQKMDLLLGCIDEKGIRLHPSATETMRTDRNRWHQRWWLFAWATLVTLLILS